MTKKISELAQLTAVADDDIIPLVDVSDTTMGATGTTKYIERDDLIRAPYNAMSRQAIMNGNFDIWQRGTSVAIPQTTATYQADRWYDYADDDGGTAPTLTRSRQPLTSGDIANSFFYTRLATNGAGTSLGNGSLHFYAQKIENGTRNLCGLNKEVTLSFYARSSIANKKLGAYLYQGYGTGGSPSSGEVINGTSWTLTSTWTKYTHTFTTNTLVGKTFGTGYDDSLWTLFAYAWGSTNASRVGDTVAETYVGSGNIDIAQVQLNAGDEALEFNPKSYEEELRACQRYYVQWGGAAGTAVTDQGAAFSSTGGWFLCSTPVEMRIVPALSAPAAANFTISDGVTGTVCTNVAVNAGASTTKRVRIDGTVAAGLTQFRAYQLQLNATGYLGLTAEI